MANLLTAEAQEDHRDRGCINLPHRSGGVFVHGVQKRGRHMGLRCHHDRGHLQRARLARLDAKTAGNLTKSAHRDAGPHGGSEGPRQGPGQGGDTVWRESLMPEEKAVLKRYFQTEEGNR